jgi:rhamnopyranosyl-N-acetylglucosaminyl-diphospho-decaprenol beta-1,3/1,4-galactofuranosyltransferase
MTITPLDDNVSTKATNSVCAVVVTFNRKARLKACLNAIAAQSVRLDGVIAVDNASTDGTAEMLAREYPEVKTIRLPANEGGAGGFSVGISAAVKEGYDWVWTFDDDCLPQEDALEALWVRRAESGVLNCLVVSETCEKELVFGMPRLPAAKLRGLHGFFSDREELTRRSINGAYPWVHPFNGTLIHRAVIDQIGPPKREMFIWGDEVDYSWKFSKVTQPLTILASVVHHPPTSARAKDVPTWRYMYRARNQMYIARTHGPYRPLRIAYRIVTAYLGRPSNVPVASVTKAIVDGILGRWSAYHKLPNAY